MKKRAIHSPKFWLPMLLIAFGCSLFFVRFFPEAQPMLDLDITMSREAAIETAQELAAKHNWGPENARHTSTFNDDTTTRVYVDLEAGGSQAVAEMIRGDLYSPYTWEVRLFREHEVNETRVFFTPDGQPYGFLEKISEDQAGAALDAESARAIAETTATDQWNIALNEYKLVEKSQNKRPNGRIDHSFVYERPQVKLNEATYRLQLVVSGNRLTKLKHYVKVPEPFKRRFENMRASNDTIALVALLVAYGLYFFVGCLLGLFFLFRARAVAWKPAVVWAGVIVLLSGASQINQLPLYWMEYDTTESTTQFIGNLVGQLAMETLMMGLILALIFMAAEGLTRRAFPGFVQFWRSWSPAVANTKTVAGLTAAGFLIVPILLAYDIIVYWAGFKFLGWWTPADPKINPDIFAQYLPWLSPIAEALQAGFLEECMFRAIPLAGASLIGRRIGRQKLLVGITLILQAVIFGAAHADYPQQPSYARIIELTPAFIAFGLIYLRFGLLPVIIAHFLVDVVLISLPLFFANTPGVWAHQGMVIVCAAVPAVVILIRRMQVGSWTALSENARNKAWSAPVGQAMTHRPALSFSGFSPRAIKLWGILAVLSAATWLLLTDFSSAAKPLRMDRKDSIAVARQALADCGITVPEDYQALSSFSGGVGRSSRFIWQEYGESTYTNLQDKGYLSTPSWAVRFVRFDESIDLAERAEEFRVTVSGSGDVSHIVHKLPENRSGANWTQNEAFESVSSFLKAHEGIDVSDLKEVSVSPSKHPNRKDWTFTYAEPDLLSTNNGEARLIVSVGSDGLRQIRRTLHLPEVWKRTERGKEATYQIINQICFSAVSILFLVGLAFAIVQASRKHFSLRIFAGSSLLIVLLTILSSANTWPEHVATFSTAEPFTQQVIQLLTKIFLSMLYFIITPCILAIRPAHETKCSSNWRDSIPALGAGILAALLLALAELPAASLAPFWPSFSGAGTFSPLAATSITTILFYLVRLAGLMLILNIYALISSAHTGRRILATLWLVLIGFVLAGREEVASIPTWLCSGIAHSGLLIGLNAFIFRRQAGMAALTLGVMMMMGHLHQAALAAYPGAMPAHILGALSIAIITWICWREMKRN